MESGARAIRAPGTMINPESFSKYFLRSPTAFVPSLFQLETFVKAPTLPRVFVNKIHDALGIEETSACVVFVPYRFAISNSRFRLKVPRAKASASDAEILLREA